MGEWMEAYIDGKNSEPNYIGYRGDSTERMCWGVADRKGICENIVRGSRVYCDDCRAYFDSGEWKDKTTGSHD